MSKDPKYQKEVLESMLEKEENKNCADCGARGPRWCSTNLGVFLCIRCSGIHRKMGTHISKVKSVTLDQWTIPQLDHFKKIGNRRANRAYEATLPEHARPHASDDYEMEQFIRDKYEKRRFYKKKGKKKTRHTSKSTQQTKSTRKKRVNKPAPPSPTMQQKTTANSLLNFDTPQQNQVQQQQQMQQQAKPTDLLFGLSNTNATPQNNANNVNNTGLLQAQQKPNISKDQLLSLYATPIQPQANQPQQQPMMPGFGANNVPQKPNYNIRAYPNQVGYNQQQMYYGQGQTGYVVNPLAYQPNPVAYQPNPLAYQQNPNYNQNTFQPGNNFRG